MNVWKPVELALTGAARLAWPVFQAANRQFEGRSFHPKWAPAPLLKSRQRSRPRFGWPRTTDSLCPTCVRETRARILSGEQSIASLVDGKRRRNSGPHPRARRQGRHRKDVPHSRHVHRHAVDQSGIARTARVAVSGARLRCGHRPAAQSRHLIDQVRARRGPDDRPDEPLQHDVRPVLHGRQPGRLRPRAHARRGQAAAGRCAQRQAAAADDGAVLGRRTDDLADLPRCRALRAAGRLLQRSGRDQRHPLRAGRRLRAPGARRRACASRTCSSTASPTPPTATARSATSST